MLNTNKLALNTNYKKDHKTQQVSKALSPLNCNTAKENQEVDAQLQKIQIKKSGSQYEKEKMSLALTKKETTLVSSTRDHERIGSAKLNLKSNETNSGTSITKRKSINESSDKNAFYSRQISKDGKPIRLSFARTSLPLDRLNPQPEDIEGAANGGSSTRREGRRMPITVKS